MISDLHRVFDDRFSKSSFSRRFLGRGVGVSRRQSGLVMGGGRATRSDSGSDCFLGAGSGVVWISRHRFGTVCTKPCCEISPVGSALGRRATAASFTASYFPVRCSPSPSLCIISVAVMHWARPKHIWPNLLSIILRYRGGAGGSGSAGASYLQRGPPWIPRPASSWYELCEVLRSL